PAPTSAPRACPGMTATASSQSPAITQYATFDLSLSGNADLNASPTRHSSDPDGGASWSSTGAIQTSLVDGDYRFHAVVTDPAGNSAISNVIEVKVDNTEIGRATCRETGLSEQVSGQSAMTIQDATFDRSIGVSANLN